MGKRKRVTKSLEEAERGMYKTFSSAANAVSLLYTQVRPPFFSRVRGKQTDWNPTHHTACWPPPPSGPVAHGPIPPTSWREY